MKQSNKLVVLAALLLLVLTAFAPYGVARADSGVVTGTTVDTATDTGAVDAKQAGTTLSATVTGAGYWKETVAYDWSLTKTANPTSLTLAKNASATVHYILVATRGAPTITDIYGVAGEACVTNGGAVTTENLQIVFQVEYKVGNGQFQPLPGATQTVIPSPLAAGASNCYAYDITFAPVAGAIYRIVANVTITNHSGWLPGGNNCPGPALCPFGPSPKADFSLPTSPAITLIDAEADLVDVLACPSGFTCSAGAGPWHLTDSQTIGYDITVTNASACATTAQMVNTATLTEATTGATHVASASVAITAPACQTTNCTRTIGFWKTHAGGGPQPDLVTPLLPIWLGNANGLKSVRVLTAAQAVTLLNMNGQASNGINKLYAQLLAARLNIASGSDASAVSSAIIAADNFLATKNAADWSTLTQIQRQQVLNWASLFDRYNNGLIGPGHCGCNH